MDMERDNDRHYDILDLDLTLHEPGEVEDTRLQDLSAQVTIEDDYAHLANQVDSSSRAVQGSGLTAFVCILGITLPEGLGTLARGLFRRRFDADLRRLLRIGEQVVEAEERRFVLTLGAKDENEARSRLEMLACQASVCLTSDGEVAELRSGFAPVRDNNGLHALHSAALALEMGVFHQAGHVEFIDI